MSSVKLSLNELMRKYPSHFEGLLRPVKERATIIGKYKPYVLDSSFSHIICNCRNNLFRIYWSDYPEVKGVCSSCGEEHIFYDAACYPAATGYDPDKGNFNRWVSATGNELFRIIAIWLYPAYPDHRDDVDWFVMITIDPETGEYTEILNFQS